MDSRWVGTRAVVAGLFAAGAMFGSHEARADALPKDDAAKAMVLLLSLSHALAQKGGRAAVPAKPEAKPLPVAATEAPVDTAASAPSAADTGTGSTGTVPPAPER